MKFDHDFIGRAALQAMAGQRHRRKVTLRWNRAAVLRVFASLFETGDRFKFVDIPASHQATLPYDAVIAGGRTVGISHYPVYTSNVAGWISLALVDPDWAAEGSEVAILWGEPGGGSRKPTVERHVQTGIRAVVEPCPIAPVARTTYRR